MLSFFNILPAEFLQTLVLIGFLTWYLPGQILVHSRLKNAPAIMLWAWERPEDIRGVLFDVNKLGVAYLAATINISNSKLIVHRRHQPLLAAHNSYLMPVVRIETDHKDPPFFLDDQINSVVAQILQIAAGQNACGLQIDFDATKNQRDSYKTILTKLRSALPPNMPLSITAIASWCAGDYWLRDLPVDEVVPMYFDMGVNDNLKWQYYQYISDLSGNFVTANCKCNSSIGLSVSEIIPLRPAQYKYKRIYIFSPHPWQTLSKQERNEIAKIIKYTEAS